MAIITLAGSGAQWAGDVNGHGGVLLYDASNRPLLPIVSGAYTAPIEQRHTAADAAGSTVWNLQGPPSLKAYLRAIHGIIAFDGTATSATTLRFGFYRGAGSSSPTGGIALTAEKKSSTMPASTVASLRGNGILTTTGIIYDSNAFAVVAIPASPTGGSARFNLRFEQPEELDSAFMFGTNEHFAIRLQVAAVIGFGMYGMVEWDER